jgi:hypothetical protein
MYLEVRKSQKDWICKSQIRKMPHAHLRKVRKSNRLFKTVGWRGGGEGASFH